MGNKRDYIKNKKVFANVARKDFFIKLNMYIIIT